MNSLDVNVYLWISNLLDRKNINNGVYTGTGQPNNDGYFSTKGGQTWLGNNGQGAGDLYDYLDNNLGFYSAPRQVRLGVRLGL